MVLPIHIYGNKILSTPGVNLDSNYPDLKQLIENMFETMKKASGIGLAAQQIGLALNLFVVDITVYKEGDPGLKEFKKVFINSEIIEFGEEEKSYDEGCLSIPGVHLPVIRPTKLKLKYFDEDFKEHEEWFDGLAARCIQHEYDHTQGNLIILRTTPFARKMSQSKFKEIKEQKFSTNYRYKM